MVVSIKCEISDYRLLAQRITFEAFNVLAATMQTNRGMIFHKEGAYNGRPKWAPLKFRSGQILKDRGTLSKSMGPMNDGITPAMTDGSILRMNQNRGIVTIGTNIKYAAVHDQDGIWGSELIIRPKRANGWLKFPVPIYKRDKKGNVLKKTGERFIFCKQVTIPSRPFSDINVQDINEFTTTMENYFEDVIK